MTDDMIVFIRFFSPRRYTRVDIKKSKPLILRCCWQSSAAFLGTVDRQSVWKKGIVFLGCQRTRGKRYACAHTNFQSQTSEKNPSKSHIPGWVSFFMSKQHATHIHLRVSNALFCKGTLCPDNTTMRKTLVSDLCLGRGLPTCKPLQDLLYVTSRDEAACGNAGGSLFRAWNLQSLFI